MAGAVKLYRNFNGSVVHGEACRYVGPSTWSWVWAQGRSRTEILAAMETYGSKACGTCDPMKEESWTAGA